MEQQPHILVVDDDPTNVELLERYLQETMGCRVTTLLDGKETIATVHSARPDLILLDVMMPDISGFEICEHLKHDPETQDIPIILLTALNTIRDKVRGLEAGADDFIGKPFDPLELQARIRSLLRIKYLHDQLERAEHVLFALVRAVEAKDPYTRGHSQRIAEYTIRLARRIKLPEREARALRYAAYLHDIGKIGIPEQILYKNGALNERERTIIREHPRIGANILQPLRFATEVAPIVEAHHEHWDGSGYPNGLRGEEIPIGARILAIADSFDAMTTDRPYRKKLSLQEALRRLQEGAGKQWDPRLVQEFIQMILEEHPLAV